MRARPLSHAAVVLCLPTMLALGCNPARPDRTRVPAPAQTAAAAQAQPQGQPTETGITAEQARAAGPPAPANLAATYRSGAVHLSWMPGSSAAKEFHLYRMTGTGPSNFKLVATVRSSPTPPITVDDSTITAGMSYTYFVAAVDEFGQQSGASNMIVITAK